MFSIVIPTLNNINYLKMCISSIKNSKYDHEIIVHVNIGSDGTLEFLKKNNIKFTYTDYNAGICEGVNKASKIASKDFLLYSHDDFYFCPGWDHIMKKELELINSELFYLSGTMVQNGQVEYDCGDNLKNFNELKLLQNYKNIKFYDFQGSTWAPHLIHKNTWNKVGAFLKNSFLVQDLTRI